MKESEYINVVNLARLRAMQVILVGIYSVKDEHDEDRRELYNLLEKMIARCRQCMGHLSTKGNNDE